MCLPEFQWPMISAGTKELMFCNWKRFGQKVSFEKEISGGKKDKRSSHDHETPQAFSIDEMIHDVRAHIRSRQI